MRVVLAIDHSQTSDAAIAFLAQQAFTQKVDLDIISVIPPLPYIDASGGGALGVGMIPDVGNFILQEQEHVKQILEATTTRLEGRFQSIQRVVKVGSPEREIRAYADSCDADLVILGAVGHSAVARMLLGSVSDYVATHVNASALVIRPRDEPGAAPVPRRVLLAVGASAQDLQLVDRLCWLDLPRSTEVHLVHVAQLMTFFRQDLKERSSDFWLQSRVAALDYLSSIEESLQPHGFPVSTKLLSESHIGEALVVYADEHDCDLILTCDRHRGVLDRAVLGSTSRYLLRHAHGSVMVVRASAPDAAKR